MIDISKINTTNKHLRQYHHNNNFKLKCLSISHVYTPKGKEWKSLRRRGFFTFDPDVKDINSSIQTNMYVLEVDNDDVIIWISLHQLSNRSKGNESLGMIDFGFTVMELNANGNFDPLDNACTGIAYVREHTMKVHIKKKGRYVIVPISSGAIFRKRREEWKENEKERKAGKYTDVSKKTKKCLEEIFRRLDGVSIRALFHRNGENHERSKTFIEVINVML